MKKILLLFSFIGFSISAFAQSVSFGVRGGVSFANQQWTNETANDETFTHKGITTFSAGVFADIKYGHFSVQPGFFLSGQGGESFLYFNPRLPSGQQFFVSQFSKVNLLYGQIPVDLVYHIPIGVGNIYFGAGPYAAIGLSGKITGTTDRTVSSDSSQNFHATFSNKAKFGGDSTDYKSVYFGANAIAGIQFKNGILFNVGYDLGLSSINHVYPGYLAVKDDQFTISIGYRFK